MKILDTTIRDGSYAVNFSFSCLDVETICTRLESLGLRYIEIGHGMGLNASSVENGLSLHTDLEYMRTANRVLNQAKFGFFCIPGIARLDDLRIASSEGAAFVRIGINVDAVPRSESYITEAKKLGLHVITNYMKSYAVTPKEFAKNVKLSEQYGADCVYIVDSAGGMRHDDILRYYEAIREVSDIALGFHGHDNLGLAVANSVYCAGLGFDLIDSSLQGLGRSSGNASTELLCAVLDKQGIKLGIDIPELFNAGYETLSPIVRRQLRNPLDMACGYAEFHTSYMKYIHKYAAMYNVDALKLIIAYCEHDKLNMDTKLLAKVAEKLPKDGGKHRYLFSDYIGNEQDR